jgi:8-oxo-dGTP diphosphatase
MDTPEGTDVRCSTVVFRDDALLLIHRVGDGADDWTLPGGTPRAGESMAACARRETREETGLTVEPTRVAFVLEALRPGSARRTVDLVFLASPSARGEPEPQEPDREARFVPLKLLPELSMRPPLAGYLRALNASGAARTAAYLGNMWRPAGDDGRIARLYGKGGYGLPGMYDNDAGDVYGPRRDRLLRPVRSRYLPRPREDPGPARRAGGRGSAVARGASCHVCHLLQRV